MTFELRSIAATGPRRYTAVLLVDGFERSFTFSVELHRGIELVTWEPDFSELIGGYVGTEPLLAAIHAFHKAQKMQVG